MQKVLKNHLNQKVKMNNILEGAIREGISLISNPNLSEQQFNIWLEYSKNLLNLATKNSTYISNYYTVIIAANTGKLQPYQKLSMCLQYLISIQPQI